VIRAVFDTVVILRAYINPGSRWGHLLAQHTDRYRLIVSPALVAEYLDVLLRPELLGRFATLANLDTASVFSLLARTDVVRPITVPAICRDPKDDMVLATAATGRAGYIVSEDRDLLDLGTHGEIRIAGAAQFLAVLNEWEGR
jgi:putative PIN family toxin of toxin-antitoxin system